MYQLTHEDVTRLTRSCSKFKILVPLKDLEAQCDSAILKELFENLLDNALRYSESVCRFQRVVTEVAAGKSFDPAGEREAIESIRGSIHDNFIASVNILSRMMARAHKDITWRTRAGEDRAALGRFALTMSFEYVKNEIEGGGL